MVDLPTRSAMQDLRREIVHLVHPVFSIQRMQRVRMAVHILADLSHPRMVPDIPHADPCLRVLIQAATDEIYEL